MSAQSEVMRALASIAQPWELDRKNRGNPNGVALTNRVRAERALFAGKCGAQSVRTYFPMELAARAHIHPRGIAVSDMCRLVVGFLLDRSDGSHP